MTTLLWLTRDFRLHDNPALLAAVQRGPVLPVFLIDRSIAELGSAPRWRLQRALEAFDAAWHHATGEHLTVLKGEAADLLPDLAQEVGAVGIVQNDWPWAPIRAAQSALAQRLAGGAIGFMRFKGHLLIDPQRVHQAKGKVYRVFTPFSRAVRDLGPDSPVATPDHIQSLPSRGRLSDHLPLAPDMYGGAAVLAQAALPAGEAAALDLMEEFLTHPAAYAEGRDRPDLNHCSSLSEHLALGEISARYIWAQAALQAQIHPERQSGITLFLTQLIWRDFAWHLMLDFRALASQCWRPEWEAFPWKSESRATEAWQQAATGVPIVDAGLREMRVTGRMHNRVRMVVASWLTKHLLADWRIGERFFADSLTDWDPAANAMNWQWVAGCGPDASPFFRIFNPYTQAERFDPKGAYCRHWLNTPQTLALYDQAVPKAWRKARPAPPSAAELKDRREEALLALAQFKIARDEGV